MARTGTITISSADAAVIEDLGTQLHGSELHLGLSQAVKVILLKIASGEYKLTQVKRKPAPKPDATEETETE